MPATMPSACVPALFDRGRKKAFQFPTEGSIFKGKVEGISGVARPKGNAPSRKLKLRHMAPPCAESNFNLSDIKQCNPMLVY